jgi:hypothetical protein
MILYCPNAFLLPQVLTTAMGKFADRVHLARQLSGDEEQQAQDIVKIDTERSGRWPRQAWTTDPPERIWRLTLTGRGRARTPV